MPFDEPSEASKKRAAGSPTDNKAKKAKIESYRELLGSEMVDIYVGKKRKHFHIHKGILCQKIPYFDKMFNGGFKEGLNNKAEFPEDDAMAFDFLQEWVYTGKLRAIGWKQIDEATYEPNYPVIPFCVLLDKLCLPRLLDEFVSRYIEYEQQENCFADGETFSQAYRLLPNSSKFRRYCLLCYHHILNAQSRTEDFRKMWPLEELKEVMATSSAFRSDFINLLREHPLGEVIEDPREMPRCTFHEHGADEECPVEAKD